ncbi:hypothetical protein Tco_0163458 [Tanacetum coccineum]
MFVGGHQFLIDFIILENINEFMEKKLTEVLFGQPFKEHLGIIEDRVKGVIWFKIGDDKTLFNMPRAEKRFGKLTVRQHNTMGPILKISDEDKSRGIHHPYQKIKGFYQGCLELGEEYKHDQEVIDWIKGFNHSEDTLLQHLGKALDNGLVVMESNGTELDVQDDNNRTTPMSTNLNHVEGQGLTSI